MRSELGYHAAVRLGLRKVRDRNHGTAEEEPAIGDSLADELDAAPVA